MIGDFPIGAAPIAALYGSVNITETISDSVGANTSVLATLTAQLHDTIRVLTTLSSKAAYHLALSDHANASVALHVVWNNLLTSTANATATVAFTASVIQNIVDTLLATGEVHSTLAARNAIVEAVFVADKLNRDVPVSLTDVAVLQEQMQSTLVTTMLIVDDALATVTLGSHVNATVVVHEGVTVTDLAHHVLGAHEHLQDRVLCVLSFQLDGDTYSAVVLNTESLGVTEYQNWPFNSFAPFAGSYIGCAEDGVYLLEGEDDNGTPIDSYIRTGLIQIGNGKKARCPEAFFGLTVDGDLVLKTITTHPSGEKVENWYRLERRTADANRSTRTKIGRGLESVYWAYELHSVDGSAFGLDSIRLYPMILDRMI